MVECISAQLAEQENSLINYINADYKLDNGKNIICKKHIILRVNNSHVVGEIILQDYLMVF